jgi:hypothetical protein
VLRNVLWTQRIYAKKSSLTFLNFWISAQHDTESQLLSILWTWMNPPPGSPALNPIFLFFYYLMVWRSVVSNFLIFRSWKYLCLPYSQCDTCLRPSNRIKTKNKIHGHDQHEKEEFIIWNCHCKNQTLQN